MDVRVRVQPRAARNRVEVVEGQTVKVYVTAAPVGGKANDAVVALLAKELGVARSSVQIVKGHTGRDKRIRVEGLDPAEALARLSAR